MSDVLAASERLGLSREHLRRAMREISAAPDHATNPLQLAGQMANDAVKRAVQPLAQRNPLALVLGAAVAGGVLAWSRPWRWLLTPALLATLLPQLLSKAFHTGGPLPWMKLLTALTQPHHKPAQPRR